MDAIPLPAPLPTRQHRTVGVCTIMAGRQAQCAYAVPTYPEDTVTLVVRRGEAQPDFYVMEGVPGFFRDAPEFQDGRAMVEMREGRANEHTFQARCTQLTDGLICTGDMLLRACGEPVWEVGPDGTVRLVCLDEVGEGEVFPAPHVLFGLPEVDEVLVAARILRPDAEDVLEPVWVVAPEALGFRGALSGVDAGTYLMALRRASRLYGEEFPEDASGMLADGRALLVVARYGNTPAGGQ